MRLKHPLADRDAPTPAAVTVAPGENVPVEDGAIEVSDDVAERVRRAWRDQYGVDVGKVDPETADLVAEMEAAAEDTEE